MRDGDRLGVPVHRRLAARRPAGAAPEAATGDGRDQRRALLHAWPARCCSPPTWSACRRTSSSAMFAQRPGDRRPRTAATTCCCSAATPVPTAGACAPTACRSPASTRRPARRCCSGCRATCSTSRSPRARSWPSSSPTATTAAASASSTRWPRGPPTTRASSRACANPGVEATKEGVEGITGLKINYYAMVNLQGFQKLVDAVGGVTLNVRDRIPIGGIGAPVIRLHQAGQAQAQRLRDAVVRPLARGRRRLLADGPAEVRDERDAAPAQPPDRGARSSTKIAKASQALITTDLPQSEVDTFMQLALKARSKPVRTVSFVPPMISTGDPDIDKIHATVQKAIDRSEGKTRRRRRPRRSPRPPRPDPHGTTRRLDRQPASRATPPTRPRTSSSAC